MFKYYLLHFIILDNYSKNASKTKNRSVAKTRSTRANPCNDFSTGKELIETMPMVPIKIEPFSTPSTNASNKSQSLKKVSPTRKPRISKRVTKTNAVIHLKSGGAKTFKSSKQAQDYLNNMQQNCGIESIQDMKTFLFDDNQAFVNACIACKIGQNPTNTFTSSQTSIPFGTSEISDTTTSQTQSPVGMIIPSPPSIPLPNPGSQQTSLQTNVHPLAQALFNKFDKTKQPAFVNPTSIEPMLPKLPASNKTVKAGLFLEIPPDLSVSNPGVASTQANSHIMLADNLKIYFSPTGCRFQLILLPPVLCVSDNQSYQVFAIDLIKNKSCNTLWTHKASAWAAVFSMDKSLSQEEGGHNIVNFFYNLTRLAVY
jgi:hypothetical protein